jgi:hypothetical protein
MNSDQQQGYDFARGATKYFAKLALLWLIVFAAFNFLRIYGGYGMDATDAGSRHRSGLRLHTDYGTGVQYLSDGQGGLVRRDSK